MKKFFFLGSFLFFAFYLVQKKMGRPILANLPTYYVPFYSLNAQPTYLPKIGTSLMDVPLGRYFLSLFHMVLHGSCVMESVYFEVCNHLFNYGIFTNSYAQRCFLMICSDASKQIEVEICNYFL